MNHDLLRIFEKFETNGSFYSGDPFGSGHIHDTYRITTTGENCDDYILQRINSNIFCNVPLLQENIFRVTSHISNKLAASGEGDISRRCLKTVSLKESRQTWFSDEQKNYWRLFVFIKDHKTFDHVETPWQAFEGGKAIGRFQAQLADLPAPPLHETIPDFHNIIKRLENFHRAISADTAGRVVEVKDEIREIINREEIMKTIINLGSKALIPLRITHNDTKFNNIIFDRNDKALCVIDLDTVMPGYVHYDFGDAIRTAACTAEEDEADLDKVTMNIEIFRSFAEGYLSETRDTLNSTEKEYLALSPSLMAYTMATRFLTDYIEGDVYYKIKHVHHNLQRVRAQLKLIKSMEEQYPEMKKIIRELI